MVKDTTNHVGRPGLQLTQSLRLNSGDGRREGIVPGHGPMIDKRGVRKVQDYLLYIHTESGFDIPLTEYAVWQDAEFIAVNVKALYREFGGDYSPPNVMDLFWPYGQTKTKKVDNNKKCLWQLIRMSRKPKKS